MNDEKLSSPNDIKTFLSGSSKVEFTIKSTEKHSWLARFIKQVNYFSLKKRDKIPIREYMLNMTSYSRQQLTKLIAQYRDKRWIGSKTQQKNTFPKKYTKEDIVLLAATDEYHLTLSGGATKKLFERAFLVYKDSNYQRLSNISIAHIYNLRKSQTYKIKRLVLTKTNSTLSLIGERKNHAQTINLDISELIQFIKVIWMVVKEYITLMLSMKLLNLRLYVALKKSAKCF